MKSIEKYCKISETAKTQNNVNFAAHVCVVSRSTVLAVKITTFGVELIRMSFVFLCAWTAREAAACSVNFT